MAFSHRVVLGSWFVLGRAVWGELSPWFWALADGKDGPEPMARKTRQVAAAEAAMTFRRVKVVDIASMVLLLFENVGLTGADSPCRFARTLTDINLVRYDFDVAVCGF
jgi:hypothetical protein